MRLGNLFFSFILGFLLVACSAQPVQVIIPSATASPLPATPLPSSTPVPPTAASLPTPTLAADFIHLVEAGSWGKGRITAAEYSPDGKRLAVVTPLGIYFYDAQSLEQLDFIPNISDWPSVAFSPDWSLLAIGSGPRITLTRLPDQSAAGQIETTAGSITMLLFSPDGHTLAGLVRPPGEEVYTQILMAWEMPTGKLLASWKTATNPSILFSANSQSITVWYPITSGAANQRWQISTGRALPVDNSVFPILRTLGPDGNLVVSAGPTTAQIPDQIGSVSVGAGYNTLTWRQVGFPGPLYDDLNGSLIIGLSSDGQAKVWRGKDGILQRSFDISAAQPQLMAISPHGQAIALLAQDGLAFYDLTSGLMLNYLHRHTAAIDLAAISPRGDRVAALLEDADPEKIDLALWSFPDEKLIYRLTLAGVLDMAWSPAGDRLALAGLDGKIRILNAIDGQLLQTLSGHPQQVQRVAWSPDGTRLASGSFSVKVWQVSDSSLLADLSGSGQWVTNLHFSPDGMSLAGSDMDGKVYVWQISERKKINEIPVSSIGSSSLIEFAPDGNLLAVAEKARVWFYHLNEKQPFQQLPVLAADVAALRISPNSQWLVCALADGTIQVWQVPQGVLLETIQSGMSTVSNLDFSKDGKTLLAAFRDGTIRFWNIQK